MRATASSGSPGSSTPTLARFRPELSARVIALTVIYMDADMRLAAPRNRTRRSMGDLVRRLA